LLPDIFPVSFPGVKTSRDNFLVDVGKRCACRTVGKYFDPEISHEEMKRLDSGVMDNSARFKAEPVRDELSQARLLEKERRAVLLPSI